MKNHSFKVEILIFSSILLLFIVPPFFAPLAENDSQLFQWNFPWQQIMYGVIAGLIFFYLKDPKEKIIFLRFPVLLILGLLFCTSLVMKFVSALFSGDQEASVLLPQSFVQWVFCILTFLPSAFFEEVIYRFYFPDALINLVQRKFTKKIAYILCEIFACLVFAFAHYYLGWLSVINAVFGHLILRFSYKKNKTLWPGVAAHFFYNVMSLILL